MIFLLASFTDLVDGWVARRFDCVTHLGAFLDPLADKIVTNVLLVFLASRYPDYFPYG
jgi:CDP-diacylglycerol--glycerol-3-phosphate 3-phosphatidyltransferase